MSELQVKYGSIQNPYREFTLVIPANSFTDPIRYNFDYFRLLEASGPGVEVQFGSSGETTSVVSAGIGYKLPYVIQECRFANRTGTAITITIALAIGDISDDRLNVSGSLNLSKSTVIDTRSDVTLTAATATQIAPADTARRELIVTNMTGEFIRIGDSGVGATSGARVADGASVTLTGSFAVFGYSVAGGAVSITETKD